MYVACLENGGYAASLEPRKIYRRIPDPKAESGPNLLQPASPCPSRSHAAARSRAPWMTPRMATVAMSGCSS